MNLRPLGDRVLIKPLASPDRTESGILLVEHRKPEEIGTVVAVGTPAHPMKAEAHVLADRLAGYLTAQGAEDSILIRTLVAREPCVKEGDTVLFSWAAGQELIDHDADERYLLLKEDDLIAVVESDPA